MYDSRCPALPVASRTDDKPEKAKCSWKLSTRGIRVADASGYGGLHAALVRVNVQKSGSDSLEPNLPQTWASMAGGFCTFSVGSAWSGLGKLEHPGQEAHASECEADQR